MTKWIFLFSFIFTIITIFILLFVISSSFMSMSEIQFRYGAVDTGNNMEQYANYKFFPNKITLEQYKVAFWLTSDFWYYFQNSLKICIPILIGTVTISTLGAYGFAIYRFKGNKILFRIMVLIMMLPYQILLIPQFVAMSKLNLLNQNISVVLPNIFGPFGCFLMYQFIKKIPYEIIESARVDGANERKIFTKIMLPQIRNGIFSLIILNVIDTWNLIEQPLLFLNDKFKYPLSLAVSSFSNDGGLVMFSCCVMFTIPVALLFLHCKEYLVTGIKESVIRK